MRRLRNLTWIACALACLAPLPLAAEGFLDLYAGVALTDNQRVKIESVFPTVRDHSHYDPAVAGGARLGWWMDDHDWVGVALDISHFQPEYARSQGTDLELSIFPVSGLLMFRYPLLGENRSSDEDGDDDSPPGPLQPYIGLGPTMIWSEARYSAGGGRLEDNQRDVGFDGRAGLAFVLGERIGIFAEYRFLFFRAIYDDDVMGTGFEAHVQHISNHFSAGLSLRF